MGEWVLFPGLDPPVPSETEPESDEILKSVKGERPGVRG